MLFRRLLTLVVCAMLLTASIACNGNKNVNSNAGNSNTSTEDKKREWLNNAADFIDSVARAERYVRRFSPSAADKLLTGVSIGSKIRDGIESGDITSASAALATAIPIIDDILANDLPKLPESTRLTIMGILALADIALHYLTRQFLDNQPAALAPSAGTLQLYNQREVWGHDYEIPADLRQRAEARRR